MFGAIAARAEQTGHDRVMEMNHASSYAGQERRAIKSLSEADIAELRRGGGWGLAKAAELNGVPGPVHLLEMKDEIALDPDQVAAIERIFERMRARAIVLGERLIELESELDRLFRTRAVTDRRLREVLDAIAETGRDLRYVHLAAHLEMADIVSPEQVAHYNALRGYAGQDPCGNVPEGHDAAMWRKHNGCD